MASDEALDSRQARQSTREWLLAVLYVAAILVGAIARLVQVDANGLDLDESWSVWMGRQQIGEIVGSILFDRADATPPTFYVLLHVLLRLGESTYTIRAISILAGIASVWYTFRLAAHLFDIRVAVVSAWLVAIAPLHIQYSQVGRAYLLGALLALISLYYFARIIFGPSRRTIWIAVLLATAVAVYTFYVTALVVLFENAVVLFLLVRRRIARGMVARWVAGQLALAIALIPLFLPALANFTQVEPNRGQSWLARPGLESIIKTAILFTTGDPSYGPIGVTPMRLLSLATTVAILLIGAWTFIRQGWHLRIGVEAQRVLLLAGAILLTWAVAFSVSQFRPIYHERYLLFLIPLWAILNAWVITRGAGSRLRSALATTLLGLTLLALYVHYTEPQGEQWREAVAQVRSQYRVGDQVVIAPGYYARPFAYYFQGQFPADIRALAHYPALVVKDSEYVPLGSPGEEQEITIQPSAIDDSQRVWFLFGYAPVAPAVTAWLEDHFVIVDSRDYLGAHVRLMQRSEISEVGDIRRGE